jgi:hypothetical protein
MKKIYLLAIALLSLTAIQAQTSKTKKGKVVTHAKLVAPVNHGGKIQYVDFVFNTTAATESRKTMLVELLNQMKHKSLTAYFSTNYFEKDAMFLTPITYPALMKRLRDTVLVAMISKDGDKMGTKKATKDFTPDRLTGYRIKQEVYTDKQTGLERTNIIGIAPTIPLMLSNGDTISMSQPICWLKYSQCKSVLVSKALTPEPKKFDSLGWDALFVGGKVKED